MLQKIKDKACPDCHCDKIQEMKAHSQHSCGEFNERLEFTCGYMLEYSPNFSKVTNVRNCKSGERYKQIKLKKAEIEAKVADALKDYPEEIRNQFEAKWSLENTVEKVFFGGVK